MKVIIAIGSNIGDRKRYIERAIEEIEKRVGGITSKSDILETGPYGYTQQDDFLNMAIAVDTDMEPEQLLETLHAIEADLDRKREIRWGPRTIDLDIILYGDRIIDEEDLHIPHVDMYNRSFVLEPVTQIAPDMVDPRTGKKITELLSELKAEE